MKAGEICKRNVFVIGAGAAVSEAARMMRDFHTGTVVIVDDPDGELTPRGILTDRDIVVGVLAEEIDAPFELTVSDIVTGDLITAREGESIWEILKKMRLHGIRRAPVVNDIGTLTGILALDDILQVLAEELSDAAKISDRGTRREMESRT